MRRILAAVASAAVMLMALAAPASADGTQQPEGGGTGWTRVQDATPTSILANWTINPGVGAHCVSSNAGQVWITPSGNLGFKTDGTFDANGNGNCASAESPWQIYPTSTRDVFIEYGASFPTATWGALWATGGSPWPDLGEIDAAEELGFSNTCASFHYKAADGSSAVLGGNHTYSCVSNPPPQSQMTYGVKWTTNSLTFYRNGTAFYTVTSSVITSDPENVLVTNQAAGWNEGVSSTLYLRYVMAWTRPS